MKCYGLKYLKDQSGDSLWSEVYAVSNDPEKLRSICQGVTGLGWYVRGDSRAQEPKTVCYTANYNLDGPSKDNGPYYKIVELPYVV